MKKIKKITVHIFNDDAGEEGLLYSIQEFDENTNLVLDEKFDHGNNLEQRITRKYNDSNKIVEEKSFSEWEDPDQHQEYFYDDSGRLYKAKHHFMNGAFSVSHYTYDDLLKKETVRTEDEGGVTEETQMMVRDAENRILELKTTDSEGKVMRWEQYEYDDEGKMLNSTTLFDDGEVLKQTYYYELDDNGRVAYIKITNEKGQSLQEEEIDYDEHGNRIERRFEDYRRGRSGIEQWEYDELQRLSVNRTLSAEEIPLEETVYQYYDDGIVKEMEFRNAQGVNLYEYAYEYW